MLLPSPYLPLFNLTNGRKIAFWYEVDSESIWFLVLGLDGNWNGILAFQMGESYLRNQGDLEMYFSSCLERINRKIKEMFPELFAAPAPPPSEASEMARTGPMTALMELKFNRIRLEGNQLV